MTSIFNKTGFPNVKYVAYVLNRFSDGPPVHALVNKKIKKFIENVEQHVPGQDVERKRFHLLRAVFRDAPVFSGMAGPFLSECPKTAKESLNYIQDEIIDVLDYVDNPLLQVHSEVEDLIRPLIKGRPTSNYDYYRPLTIPDALMQELRENGERQSFECERSRGLLDFKPVVKLYRADGAGTWLLTHMFNERTDAASGLYHEGGGCTDLAQIRLSELHDHACNPLFRIEIDESFDATKTITEYAEEARANCQLLV